MTTTKNREKKSEIKYNNWKENYQIKATCLSSIKWSVEKFLTISKQLCFVKDLNKFHRFPCWLSVVTKVEGNTLACFQKKKKKNLNKRFVLTFRAICMQIRFHNLYHDVYTYISNGPLIVKSHEFGNMPKRSQLYSPGWLVLLLTLRRSDIKIFTFFSYLFVNASDPSRLPNSLDGRHGYHLQG